MRLPGKSVNRSAKLIGLAVVAAIACSGTWAQVAVPSGTGTVTLGSTPGLTSAVPAMAAPTTTGINAANLPGLPGRAVAQPGTGVVAAPSNSAAEAAALTGASNSPTGATSPSPTTWAISLKIRTGYERHAIRAVTAKRFPSLVGGSE